MKYAILTFIIVDLLLLGAAGFRMKAAKEVTPTYKSSSSATTPASNQSAPVDRSGNRPGDNFVNAYTDKGKAGDVPEGMEGVVGANRGNSYEVDPMNDPYADSENKKEGLDDAKDKIGLLPGGGK